MNGKYVLSQTPGAHDTQSKFPASYADYPGSATYFDVYSPPITTLYSQVFWKGLAPVELPKDIVSRFDNKGMAVIGYEVDQVRRTPEGDVSVPINVAYNHHFESNMVGKHAALEKIHLSGPDDPMARAHDMGHGIPNHGEMWVVKDLGTGGRLPISQSFGAANGGEYRKSFHGYAPGFAQVLESPTHFQVTPMQIDTWHREKMNLTHPSQFVAGPLPRNSNAPPGAAYSGLLECPVTTRIRKEIDGGYVAKVDGGLCKQNIETASECYAAAKGLAGKEHMNFTYTTVADTSLPQGCSAVADASSQGKVNVIFNSLATSVHCGSGDGVSSGGAQSLVHVGLEIDATKDIVTISLTGPDDVWFGVGFNAQAMADKPWAVIIESGGKVSERQLQDQNPGEELQQSVTVVSSSVVGGQRKVVLQRPLKGLTPAHFTFKKDESPVFPMINAVGSQPKLSYHKDKTPFTMLILPVQAKGVAGACICASKVAPFGQAKGKLVYVPTSQSGERGFGTISFPNKCAPWPRTDLLSMENPTCDIRAYSGGQSACHHMFSLLDADQEIPWPDQPLEMVLKFRFWVQEYNASYHSLVNRDTWGIASPVEYDVPKCAPNMQGCEQKEDGTWVHTITGTFTGHGSLVAAHFHCHAPTCLSFAMYRCPKGTKVCNATNGELLCREEPVYGGTGKVEVPKFDEPGYIFQPPCIWGSSEFGLEAPPNVDGYVLGSVKTSNATFGHHGEMAWQQMLYVNSKDKPKERTGVFV